MTRKEIVIPVSMARDSLAGVKEAGLDSAPLLEKSGISPEVMDRPDGYLSINQFARLNRQTSLAMKDELYGLLANPVPLGATHAMGLMMVHARTIGDALERFLEFNALFRNSLEYDRVSRGDRTELIIRRRPGWKVLNSFAIESSFAFPHRFLGWLANERILLNQVLFDYDPPDYAGDFRQIFYCAPCLFNQGKNSLQFDSYYLSHPIVQTESSLEQYFRRLPLDLYLPLEAGGETTLEVRGRVHEILRDTEEVPAFDDVAIGMGCHPQALRRRLKSEGTHYSAIRNQIRRDLAMHFLGIGELSVADIAYKVGYAEPSAFIRAFKGWTGLTPLSFRQGYHA